MVFDNVRITLTSVRICTAVRYIQSERPRPCSDDDQMMHACICTCVQAEAEDVGRAMASANVHTGRTPYTLNLNIVQGTLAWQAKQSQLFTYVHTQHVVSDCHKYTFPPAPPLLIPHPIRKETHTSHTSRSTNIDACTHVLAM